MVWVLVAILAIALAVAVVMLVRQRRSQQLREGFGPEYERTIAETGDRRAAESELPSGASAAPSSRSASSTPTRAIATPSAGAPRSARSSTSRPPRWPRPTASSPR